MVSNQETNFKHQLKKPENGNKLNIKLAKGKSNKDQSRDSEQIEKINETKSLFFKNGNRIDKLLARLTEKRREDLNNQNKKQRDNIIIYFFQD